MTLEEKLKTINEPAATKIAGVGTLPTGKADTIEDFFFSFVQPRLPSPEIIKQWHKLLMQYTDEKEWHRLSCCVRFGNEGGKKVSAKGEKEYYKLRRGWLTKNISDDFEYFFADNFFSSFVYKMALDGFVPASVEELRKAFQDHLFPYGFGFFVDNKINEYKGVVVAVGKEPGFLGNYKLSHIFDAGECFSINGKKCGDAKLSDLYYPIGHSDDFLNNSDRIRRMDISEESKKVITAKFLRFVHPFNYFLTPTKRNHICEQIVYKKDIGEDPRMISYVKQYLKSTYPLEYAEFVERIMWYEEPETIIVTGKERIDITYGINLATGTQIKPMKARSKNRNMIDFEHINEVYLNDFKVGEIANQVLRVIIQNGVNTGKITKADITILKTEKGPNSTFKLSLPLLALTRKDANGAPRYYKEPIICYGETLFLNSQWPKADVEKKRLLIKWIVDWISANGGTV